MPVRMQAACQRLHFDNALGMRSESVLAADDRNRGQKPWCARQHEGEPACRIPAYYRELMRPIPALTLVLIGSLGNLRAFFAALTFAFIACSCIDYERGNHNTGRYPLRVRR
jgi:hypothetical protein